MRVTQTSDSISVDRGSPGSVRTFPVYSPPRSPLGSAHTVDKARGEQKGSRLRSRRLQNLPPKGLVENRTIYVAIGIDCVRAQDAPGL